MRRFQPEFVLNAGHLRGYFDRTYGKRGRTELDRFVTALANQASSRAISQGTDFCRSATILMDQVLATPANELIALSAQVDGAEEIAVMPLAAR